MDALNKIGVAQMGKLLNGIYVTKDIVASRSSMLFNGHSGTKVRTVFLPMRPASEITETLRPRKVPFGYLAMSGLEMLFTSSS